MTAIISEPEMLEKNPRAALLALAQQRSQISPRHRAAALAALDDPNRRGRDLDLRPVSAEEMDSREFTEPK